MKPLFKCLIPAVAVLLFSSCGENVIEPDPASASFNVDYHVDGQELVFDQMNYRNKAGNNYSVNKMEYYLSNITLHHSGGTTYLVKDPVYVNAFNEEFTVAEFPEIPPGTYTHITMHLGLDESQNVSNSLPNISDNINMAWPDQMGGGYHFMKFEGHYKNDTSTNTTPFAMHLGTNSALVNVTVNTSFTLQSGESHAFILKMNLNEWFQTPYTYDFAVDGSHSMPDSLLRRKLAMNGADAFELEVNQINK